MADTIPRRGGRSSHRVHPGPPRPYAMLAGTRADELDGGEPLAFVPPGNSVLTTLLEAPQDKVAAHAAGLVGHNVPLPPSPGWTKWNGGKLSYLWDDVFQRDFCERGVVTRTGSHAPCSSIQVLTATSHPTPSAAAHLQRLCSQGRTRDLGELLGIVNSAETGDMYTEDELRTMIDDGMFSMFSIGLDPSGIGGACFGASDPMPTLRHVPPTRQKTRVAPWPRGVDGARLDASHLEAQMSKVVFRDGVTLFDVACKAKHSDMYDKDKCYALVLISAPAPADVAASSSDGGAADEGDLKLVPDEEEYIGETKRKPVERDTEHGLETCVPPLIRSPPFANSPSIFRCRWSLGKSIQEIREGLAAGELQYLTEKYHAGMAGDGTSIDEVNAGRDLAFYAGAGSHKASRLLTRGLDERRKGRRLLLCMIPLRVGHVAEILGVDEKHFASARKPRLLAESLLHLLARRVTKVLNMRLNLWDVGAKSTAPDDVCSCPAASPPNLLSTPHALRASTALRCTPPSRTERSSRCRRQPSTCSASTTSATARSTR